MDLAQLKAALKAGTITLAQFKEQAKALLAAQLASKAMDQAAHDAALAEVEATTEAGGGGGGAGFTPEQMAEIQKMLQSEGDKIRTQYSKKLTDAEAEAERLRRQSMTDEEKAKDDLAKANQAIADREAALARREVELHTVDALAKRQIPAAFRGFLAADNIENTDKRLDEFQGVWAAALKEAVELRFKESGGDPNKGRGGGSGDVNPWKTETLNLTKQAQIMKESPELAKQLMAAAAGK